MGATSQNDLLRRQNENLTRENNRLLRIIADLNEKLSEAKQGTARLNGFRPAQPPPPPPRQAPKRAATPEKAAPAPGEKRKHAAEEDTKERPHAKKVRFGAPESNFAFPAFKPSHAKQPTFGAPDSNFPFSAFKPTAKPFGSPSAAQNGFAFGRENFPGFGKSGAAPSPFNIQDAVKEAIRLNSLPRQPLPPRETFRDQCIRWRTHAEKVLAKAKEARFLDENDFPEPPHDPFCLQFDCEKKRKDRALKACENEVTGIFKELLKTMPTVESKKEFLKGQRKLWHPDNSGKYAGGDEEVAERMERKYGEISRIVGCLLEPLLGKSAWVGEDKVKERKL